MALPLSNKFQNTILIDRSKIDVMGFCTLKPLDYFDKIFCDYEETEYEYPANFQFS